MKSQGEADGRFQQELSEAAAKCELALLGKLDNGALLESLLRLSLLLPTSEPVLPDATNQSNWKPLMIQKAGVAWVTLFTNFEVAGDFAKANSSIEYMQIVKLRWIVNHVPENVGLAIIHKRDRVLQIQPDEVKMRRDLLRANDA